MNSRPPVWMRRHEWWCEYSDRITQEVQWKFINGKLVSPIRDDQNRCHLQQPPKALSLTVTITITWFCSTLILLILYGFQKRCEMLFDKSSDFLYVPEMDIWSVFHLTTNSSMDHDFKNNPYFLSLHSVYQLSSLNMTSNSNRHQVESTISERSRFTCPLCVTKI